MSTVDDLAAFLLERAAEPGVSYQDRGKTEGLVHAWRTGVAPAETEHALRMTGTAFREHPDYRDEWSPGRKA